MSSADLSDAGVSDSASDLRTLHSKVDLILHKLDAIGNIRNELSTFVGELRNDIYSTMNVIKDVETTAATKLLRLEIENLSLHRKLDDVVAIVSGLITGFTREEKGEKYQLGLQLNDKLQTFTKSKETHKPSLDRSASSVIPFVNPLTMETLTFEPQTKITSAAVEMGESSVNCNAQATNVRQVNAALKDARAGDINEDGKLIEAKAAAAIIVTESIITPVSVDNGSNKQPLPVVASSPVEKVDTLTESKTTPVTMDSGNNQPYARPAVATQSSNHNEALNVTPTIEKTVTVTESKTTPVTVDSSNNQPYARPVIATQSSKPNKALHVTSTIQKHPKGKNNYHYSSEELKLLAKSGESDKQANAEAAKGAKTTNESTAAKGKSELRYSLDELKLLAKSEESQKVPVLSIKTPLKAQCNVNADLSSQNAAQIHNQHHNPFKSGSKQLPQPHLQSNVNADLTPPSQSAAKSQIQHHNPFKSGNKQQQSQPQSNLNADPDRYVQGKGRGGGNQQKKDKFNISSCGPSSPSGTNVGKTGGSDQSVRKTLEKKTRENTETSVNKAFGTANASVPRDIDEISNKVRDVLKILRPENFDICLKSMLTIPLDTTEIIQQVTLLIFEKTISEPMLASTYAKLSKALMQNLKLHNKHLFNVTLIKRFQKEFETNANSGNTLKESLKPLLDKLEACTEAKERLKLQKLLEDQKKQLVENQKRTWGTLGFIGEMYLYIMVGIETIVHASNEEELEFVCKLLTTLGPVLEAKASEQADVARMNKIFHNIGDVIARDGESKISDRVSGMLQELIDLRRRRCLLKNDTAPPESMATAHVQGTKSKVVETDGTSLDQQQAMPNNILPNEETELALGKNQVQPETKTFELTASRSTPCTVSTTTTPYTSAEKVHHALEVLTPENFDETLKRLLPISFDSNEEIEHMTSLILEQMASEPVLVPTYAKFCEKLIQKITKPESKELFNTSLIKQLQKEFETNVINDCGKNEKLKSLQEKLETCTDAKERVELQAKVEDQQKQWRRRAWVTIRFIGEMYKLQLLDGDRVMLCIESLLENGSEEKLLFMCELLTKVGHLLDVKKSEQMGVTKMGRIFHRINVIIRKSRESDNRSKISSHVTSMLQELVDLRRRQWLQQNDDAAASQINKSTGASCQDKSLELKQLEDGGKAGASLEQPLQKLAEAVTPVVSLNGAQPAELSSKGTSESPPNNNIDEILQKVSDALALLAPDNFDMPLKAMLRISLNNVEEINHVTTNNYDRVKAKVTCLIFEKAISQPSFVPTYAKLCGALIHYLNSLYRTHFIACLSKRMQTEFETNVIKADDKNRKLKPLLDRLEVCPERDVKERSELQAEVEDLEYQFQRRAAATIRFIAELYKLQSGGCVLLTPDQVMLYIEALLKHGGEEKLEYMCELLTTLGHMLDANKSNEQKGGTNMDKIFHGLSDIVRGTGEMGNQPKISSRMRSKLQDVIDLRACRWGISPQNVPAPAAGNSSLYMWPQARYYGGMPAPTNDPIYRWQPPIRQTFVPLQNAAILPPGSMRMYGGQNF